MANKIYFQIQYHDDKIGQNRHSDSCIDLTADSRKLFHNLLDEWLNGQNDKSSEDPNVNSLEFYICKDHK